MSAIIVFILRLALIAALYAFLGWVMLTLWRDLKTQSALISARQVPLLNLSWIDQQETRQLAFTSSEVQIGRDPGCDCYIANDTVSSRHARLSYHHNQWWLEDLQSTNGTFLNDERLYTPTVIISGDQLRVGRVDVEIIIGDRGSPAG